MAFVNTADVQAMTPCSRPVDPPPEDLLPEYITIEELGKILARGSSSSNQEQPAPSTKQEQSAQQDYVNCLVYVAAPVQPRGSLNGEKKPVVEIDLTEDDCDEIETFTSVPKKAQSPGSSYGESELHIDITEHDIGMSTNELTSQSHKENEVGNIDESFTSVPKKAQSPRSSCSESELHIDITEHDVDMCSNEQDFTCKTELNCETGPFKTENIEESFTSVDARVQTPCSESDLHIDISEHDVAMSLNEQDSNQLTSHSHKAQFQCETCPYETDVKGHFEVHLKVHRTVFTCDWCRYNTKSKFKMRNHQIKQHKPLINHLVVDCSYCNFSSSTKQGMKKHVLKMHQKSLPKVREKGEVLPKVIAPVEVNRPDSPYSEPRLEIDLGDSAECPQSQDSTSTPNPPPIYQVLDIKIEYPDELAEKTDSTTDLTSQSKKPLFQCDICPFETDFQDQFEVHRKVHRTVYACPLCKYRTCSEVKLTRHEKFRCPNAPPKLEFECPSCTFSASSIADLKEHWTVHYHSLKSGNTPLSMEACSKFRCKTCRKRLDNQSAVDEHMWKHTFAKMRKDNSLKCPKCEFNDMSAYVMRNHYSAIHQGCPHYDPNSVEKLPAMPKPVMKK